MKSGTFVDHIHDTVRQATEKIVEEEIKKATKQFENTLREHAATVALSMARWAEVETMRDRIIITFRTEKR